MDGRLLRTFATRSANVWGSGAIVCPKNSSSSFGFGCVGGYVASVYGATKRCGFVDFGGTKSGATKRGGFVDFGGTKDGQTNRGFVDFDGATLYGATNRGFVGFVDTKDGDTNTIVH